MELRSRRKRSKTCLRWYCWNNSLTAPIQAWLYSSVTDNDSWSGRIRRFTRRTELQTGRSQEGRGIKESKGKSAQKYGLGKIDELKGQKKKKKKKTGENPKTRGATRTFAESVSFATAQTNNRPKSHNQRQTAAITSVVTTMKLGTHDEERRVPRVLRNHSHLSTKSYQQ